MVRLYNVDSPINSEQRNNLNATFEDIQRRLSNLRQEIALATGGSDTEDVIRRIEEVINRANATEVVSQQSINNVNDALNQLETALNNTNTATERADTAVVNVNAEITNLQNRVNQLGVSNTYSNTATYQLNNIVEYNGSSFIAIRQTTGNLPPTLPTKRNANWQLLAQRGVDGTGSVSQVNSIGPNTNGNVILTPEIVGAAPESHVNLRGSATDYGHLRVGTNITLNDGTISIPNASSTTTGVMRVGDGLRVSSGVVSGNYVINNTITFDLLLADFSTGTTVSFPLLNGGAALYVACNDLVNEQLGLNFNANNTNFRFQIETNRGNANSNGSQVVTVMSNNTGYAGNIFVYLERNTLISGAWGAWRYRFEISRSSGNPNGSIFGFVGCLAYDSTNGVLYRKNTGTTVNNNTGWIRIDSELVNSITNIQNEITTVIPRKTTADINFFVNSQSGLDTNDGLTTTTPFRTIQRAIENIPQIVNHSININVSAGTYAENINFNGYQGGGSIFLYGATELSSTHNLSSIVVNRVNVPVVIRGFNFTGLVSSLSARYCNFVSIQFCISTVNSEADAFVFDVSKGRIFNSQVSNRGVAIYAMNNSDVTSIVTTGSLNRIGLASTSSTIRKSGTQPSGVTDEFTLDGGQII